MDIADRIKPLVEEIAFKSVEIDEPLYTSNLIDSMGTVDLAMMLEDEFDIKIDIGSFFSKSKKKFSIFFSSSLKMIRIKSLYCLHEAFICASFIKVSIIYLKYKFVVLNSILYINCMREIFLIWNSI